MSAHADSIRIQLGRGPQQVRKLVASLGFSQPTLSRAIKALGDEIVRIGKGPSIHYALRDAMRGIGEMTIYRASATGSIRQTGTLIPVRPDGFVLLQSDGKTLHSDALPWWLFDMRPQGYLGRNYAARHAAALGLPSQLNDWDDTHALRALLAHGHDVTSNLLLGDAARDVFLAAVHDAPISENDKPQAYVHLAEEAARGEIPGSSAGGEQPKFVACAQTPAGPRHLIVKFTLAGDNPITERWRDLLLAEHLALDTLDAAGIAAVRTHITDANSALGPQRFLEIERFDRTGEFGRRGVFSMKALDAEFVGAGPAGWSAIARALAKKGCITREAAAGAALLQAVGVLIGNTDMHTGNLSFVCADDPPNTLPDNFPHAFPYHLAPAYDMLPMGFAPRAGGAIPTTLPPATLPADITPETWRQAAQAARQYLARLRGEPRFSPAFQPCINALADHLQAASDKIARLG